MPERITKTTRSPKTSVSRAGSATKKTRKLPLRITDTTLRDAHQSLWATRMRTDDIKEIIDVIDHAGYYSLECWGGATFDVCMRFLRENPWERLRFIKSRAPKTPLQMLLRGQNILGYQHYPDDVLDRFITLACQNGVDIFRIFDALNDNRNLEQAIRLVKARGAHAQGTICYTISPVHTIEAFVDVAREQEQMGVDSICIKDMAGILSPITAEKLVSALTANLKVPIQLHSHMTSGMATAAYVEGVRAGAGAIDCAISCMAGFSSQPPVETMVSIFSETEHRVALDIDCLRRINKYFTGLKALRQPGHHPPNTIDPEILVHHIPGGMISNLRSQLEQQDALDRLEEVLAELPRTRADLGYPPLVTPTSQIVGVQAVLNVLAGERYSMVPQETKEYVKGLYGRSPAPIDPAIAKKILGNEKPTKGRPADQLKPMLPTVTRDVDPTLIRGEEDILSFCLFPDPALEYFKWRNLPINERPPIPADVEMQKTAKHLSEPDEPAKPFLAKSDYEEIQKLLDKVNTLNLSEVTIRRHDLNLSLRSNGMETGQTAMPVEPAAAGAAAPPPAPSVAPPAPSPAVPEPLNTDAPSIKAPLTGTFYRSPGPGKPIFCEEGDTVKAGEPVCIVEAMKLFNQIKAPETCKVLKFLVSHGDAIKKGQPLCLIEQA